VDEVEGGEGVEGTVGVEGVEGVEGERGAGVEGVEGERGAGDAHLNLEAKWSQRSSCSMLYAPAGSSHAAALVFFHLLTNSSTAPCPIRSASHFCSLPAVLWLLFTHCSALHSLLYTQFSTCCTPLLHTHTHTHTLVTTEEAARVS